jgi:hypothetical protein
LGDGRRVSVTDGRRLGHGQQSIDRVLGPSLAQPPQEPGDSPRIAETDLIGGQSVRGAPFPPGRGQHESPERPTRLVPSAPEQGAAQSEKGSPPTAVDEEDDNGT